MSALMPFRTKRCPDGGRYVHSFAPAGTPMPEFVAPKYIIDVPALVERLQLRHEWDDCSIWVPAWLVPAIRMYMAHHTDSDISLEAFLLNGAK